jgi:thiol-disulfide isomerase/thioredoxin
MDYMIRDKPLPIGLTVRRGSQLVSLHVVRAKFSDIAANAGFRIKKNSMGYVAVPIDESPAFKNGELIAFGALSDPQCNESTLSSPTQPTFVYFWASWCSPCKELMRRMKEAGPRKVRVIGVNIDAQCETFRSLNESLQPPGEQVWTGPSSRLAQGFRVHRRGIPAGGVVDSQGKLVATALGVDSLLTLYKDASR